MRTATPCHGGQWRDADAASHKHRAAGAGVQGKVVLRRLDGDGVALFQPFVHEARTAPAFGFLAHGDHVFGRCIGGVARRVEVDERVVAPVGLAVGQGHLHADVGARREAGQRVAVVGAQAQHADQRIQFARLCDAQREGG
jgi:hypothetical protein